MAPPILAAAQSLALVPPLALPPPFSFPRVLFRFPPVLDDGRDLAGVLQVGHGAFEGGRGGRGGRGGALAGRPSQGPGASLELDVLHLGTDSGNVGLKNADFVPDLKEEEKRQGGASGASLFNGPSALKLALLCVQFKRN